MNDAWKRTKKKENLKEMPGAGVCTNKLAYFLKIKVK